MVCRLVIISSSTSLQVSPMIQIALPDSRFPLQAVVIPMGEDLLISITGGTRPHLGGVSLVDISSGGDFSRGLVLPGHRDDEPALDIGRQVAQATGRVVSVAVGIHWDGLKKQDLQEIRRNWKRLAAMIIESLPAAGER